MEKKQFQYSHVNVPYKIFFSRNFEKKKLFYTFYSRDTFKKKI